MNLFGKLGDALDGVLGRAYGKASSATKKVYKYKTPSVGIETIINAGTTKIKIAAVVGKKLVDNGKAKLKALREATVEKKEEKEAK